MRRLVFEDVIRAAEALRAVPAGARTRAVLGWLERAHMVDKARKHGVFLGPGDLASVLPGRAGNACWRASTDDLMCLRAVLDAVILWRAQRQGG